MGSVEAGLADKFFLYRWVARDGIFDKREGPRLVGTVELCLPRLPVMRVHPVMSTGAMLQSSQPNISCIMIIQLIFCLYVLYLQLYYYYYYYYSYIHNIYFIT